MGINSNFISLTGVKSTKTEHLSPISKYLVKNKDEIDIPRTSDLVSDGSQQPGPPLERSQDEATTGTTFGVETTQTSDADTPSTSKSEKTVGECREDRVSRGRVGTVKKERRGESGNRVSGRESAARVEETSNRSRTGRKGRRVAHTRDEDYVPVR